MFSALKFVAAAVIVALFGGFLLTGILTAPQEEGTPATVTESPSLTTTGGLAFPTGMFVSDEDGRTLEFRADGTCQRTGVPCTWGLNGKLYAEMTFEDPSGAQVPATYSWGFDGEYLTFEPRGTDLRPGREVAYLDDAYRLVGEALPVPPAASEFPTGQFVATDDDSRTLSFRENGRWRAGSPKGGAAGNYAVNGDLYTEMTHNEASGSQVPATYRWHWDGERLTFMLWGEDADAWRKSFYADHAYVRAEPPAGPMRTLLLSHPQLDIWVTVEISERDVGGYAAAATVDGDPLGEGVGDTQQEAVQAALVEAVGEPYASDMAESVEG